jgi:hypothetical protein
MRARRAIEGRLGPGVGAGSGSSGLGPPAPPCPQSPDCPQAPIAPPSPPTWMSASVSGSTLAVASSSMSTRLRRSMARAMHSSCFWPRLKLAPLSTTRAWGGGEGGVAGWVRAATCQQPAERSMCTAPGPATPRRPSRPRRRTWRPPSMPSTVGRSDTLPSASHSSSSLWSPKGSRLRRMSPENIKGSWGWGVGVGWRGVGEEVGWGGEGWGGVGWGGVGWQVMRRWAQAQGRRARQAVIRPRPVKAGACLAAAARCPPPLPAPPHLRDDAHSRAQRGEAQR